MKHLVFQKNYSKYRCKVTYDGRKNEHKEKSNNDTIDYYECIIIAKN